MHAHDPPPRRPFLISDAMILIVATALSLTMVSPLSNATISWLEAFIEILSSLHPTWSVATFVLAIRRPRPAFSGLMARPGFSACVVGGLATAWLLGFYRPEEAFEAMVVLTLATWCIAAAVILTWFGQAWMLGWKPDAGWVNRLGRSLGVGWILLASRMFVGLVWGWG